MFVGRVVFVCDDVRAFDECVLAEGRILDQSISHTRPYGNKEKSTIHSLDTAKSTVCVCIPYIHHHKSATTRKQQVDLIFNRQRSSSSSSSSSAPIDHVQLNAYAVQLNVLSLLQHRLASFCFVSALKCGLFHFTYLCSKLCCSSNRQI